jgi:1,4-alpha-glucan branching enzyme
MASRGTRQSLDAPISIYEMHFGSWMRSADRPGGFFSYREIAPKLAEYLNARGFTHVEFLPLMEHPFYGSGAIKPRVILRRAAATATRRI